MSQFMKGKTRLFLEVLEDRMLLSVPPVYIDDFNRPNSTSLGANWTETNGDFGIQNQTLAATSSLVNVAVFNLLSQADVSVQADVAVHNTGLSYASLVARYTGPNDSNMYLGALVGNNGVYSASIWRNANGVWTPLVTKSLGVGSGTLRFDVLGQSLTLYLNGVQVASAVDGSLAGPGLAGVRGSNGVLFDNFSVTQLLSVFPFSDDFNRPDNTSPGPVWTETAGDLAIQNQQLTAPSGLVNVGVYNSATKADVSVQADVSLPTTGFSYASLVARYAGSGDSNMYIGALVANNGVYTASIWRNVGGTWTQLTSQNVAVGTGTLRFDVLGQGLQLFLNGASVVGTVDGSLTGPGLVGVRSSAGATFDNFSVSDAPSAFPFQDDFNRADNTNLGTAWVETMGQLAIQSQGLFASGGIVNTAVYTGAKETDVSVQADVALPNTGFAYASLVARFSGPGDSNMYIGALVSHLGVKTASIWRNVGGTWTQLVSQTIGIGAGTLTFNVRGSSLQLFLNGGLVAQTVDSQISTPGLVGIRTSSGITLDNFSAIKLTQATAFSDDFNRPDNPDPGLNWTETTGDLAIQGQQLAVTSGMVNIGVFNQAAQVDVSVQADITLPTSGFAYGSLVARYSGPGDNNMYIGALMSDNGVYTASIWRNLGGTWTRLASQTVASPSGTLRFDAAGQALTLFLNGIPVVGTVDGALTRAGLAGVRGSAGALFDNFSAGPVQPITASGDNFDRPNDTFLGLQWTETLGDLSIQSQALGAIGGLINIATFNLVSQADVSVQADVGLPTSGFAYASLIARYSGPGDRNMYLGGLVSNNGVFTASIWRNAGGTWTQLTSQTVGTASGSLRFDVLGPTLNLYLNGLPVGSAVDGTITAQGLAGVRGSSGAFFDNFSVSPIVNTLPFSDDFNRPNGTNLGNAWVEAAGDLVINSQMLGASGGLVNLALYDGASLADAIVQTDVIMPIVGFAHAGLVARYTGSGDSNMYLGALNANNGFYTASIWRNVGGTWTQLSSISLQSGTGTLRFEVVGQTLKLFFNNLQILSALDTTLAGAGLTGVRTSNGPLFDNFSVA